MKKSSFGNRVVRGLVFGLIPLSVWWLNNKYIMHDMHLSYGDIFWVGALGYYCGLGDGQED
jgi:hypothetical protein